MGDLRVVDAIDRATWSSYVESHPHGNIFQTPEMAQVYRETRRYVPSLLAALDTNGEVRGLSLAQVIRELDGVVGKVLSRCVVPGGPLCDESVQGAAAAAAILKSYPGRVGRGILYTEIRNLHDVAARDAVFAEAGFKSEAHLNYLLDLSPGAEALWTALTKTKRQAVTNSRKRGARVADVGASDIPAFYSVLEATYNRAGVPLADRSLFESAFRVLGPRRLKFIAVTQGRECIGGAVALLFRDTVYLWYLCGAREQQGISPSDLAVWHLIEWGASKGFRVFDFGGAGRPDEKYGVREFKRRFGGREVDFGRHRKEHHPVLLRAALGGLKIRKRVRGR